MCAFVCCETISVLVFIRQNQRYTIYKNRSCGNAVVTKLMFDVCIEKISKLYMKKYSGVFSPKAFVFMLLAWLMCFNANAGSSASPTVVEIHNETELRNYFTMMGITSL